VRAWWRELPPSHRRGVAAVALVLYVAVAWVAVVLGSAWLSDDEPDWTRPVGPFVGAVLGFLVVTWWRRREAGALLVPEFARALRSGSLPDGADPDVWAAALERRRRFQRWSAAAGYAVLVLAAGLGVANAARAGWSWEASVVGLVVLLDLTALFGLAVRRERRRIDRLRDQVAR
jgi:hypothetical protein